MGDITIVYHVPRKRVSLNQTIKTRIDSFLRKLGGE
jgi:hypothetical protein